MTAHIPNIAVGRHTVLLEVLTDDGVPAGLE
eukprot:CAMPEP_0114156872 /NCGR_PEP_ID=MMETSP0043_2-20121206/26295_1 /TAXON_ID=464988 /ORGANISM="Hemiselmis andersenii, Strain CCMP644" /LENGTH=30 /DNA_ID= /DNA_START= /DNA_END= /DNA_ORIENTATION=